jgi:DNA-binding XRE family transcriptional regulator
MASTVVVMMTSGRPPKADERISYQVIEAGDVRLAVVTEAVLVDLARRVGVRTVPGTGSRPRADVAEVDLDGDRLAQRLIARRQRAGLTQAALARRANVRVETLNRIERGRTMPDFRTVRKLVMALNAAETAPLQPVRPEETKHADDS